MAGEIPSIIKRTYLTQNRRIGSLVLFDLTEPDFWGKISFLRIWANQAQNGPKIRFLEYNQKSNHKCGLFVCLGDRYHNYALFS